MHRLLPGRRTLIHPVIVARWWRPRMRWPHALSIFAEGTIILSVATRWRTWFIRLRTARDMRFTHHRYCRGHEIAIARGGHADALRGFLQAQLVLGFYVSREAAYCVETHDAECAPQQHAGAQHLQAEQFPEQRRFHGAILAEPSGTKARPHNIRVVSPQFPH